MLAAVTKASGTTTSTSNKRGVLWGKQLATVCVFDNCKAAAPSRIDIVYGRKTMVLLYCYNKCNDNGLCQECHGMKRKVEESLDETVAKKTAWA